MLFLGRPREEKRAVAYYRHSAEDKQENSVPIQRRLVQEYATLLHLFPLTMSVTQKHRAGERRWCFVLPETAWRYAHALAIGVRQPRDASDEVGRSPIIQNSRNPRWSSRRRLLAFVGLLALLVGAGLAAAQEPPTNGDTSPEDLASDIVEKEQSLTEIAEKIQQLKTERAAKEGQKQQLTTVVEILENRALQARLELDHTRISIEEVRLRILETEGELARLQRKQARLKAQLSELLRTLALLDRRSPLEMLVREGTFADFLGNQHALARIQSRATALLLETDALRAEREARQTDLLARQEELEQFAKLQAAQRESLVGEEQRKRRALSQTVQEAARLVSLLAEAEETRREIQQEVFVLKNAGLRLSLQQAEEFARYAAGATGVRPALLLGVLKVESNIGTNVGSGRYPDDVHPAHREAFLRVVDKLGLDPATTPVSARPTTYAGWGGALGPGQIMPGIWERIEPEVARLVGKARPSPFELLDAFVATAVILRNAGAASGNEYAAVNRYFAGPNWANFTWYGDRVLAVAKPYEERGR